MTYILLAAGPEENIPSLQSVKKEYPNAMWVGVDRGVFYLLSQQITPMFAVGDFDSLTEEERKFVEKEHISFSIFPAEKDMTDLEIAIDWAIAQNANEVIILGATGGRLDHFLMNVQLLQKGLKNNINMVLLDKGNRITLKDPGEYTIQKNSYKYVSFLPLTTEVTGITLIGFRYPLIQTKLQLGSSLCISNEIVDEEGKYSFFTGKLIVIESNDL